VRPAGLRQYPQVERLQPCSSRALYTASAITSLGGGKLGRSQAYTWQRSQRDTCLSKATAMVDDDPPAGEATNREAAALARESVGEVREDTTCVAAPEEPRAEEHVVEAPAVANDTDVSGTAEGPAAPAGGEGADGDGGGGKRASVDEAGKSPGRATGILGACFKGHAMGVQRTCDTSSGAGRGDLQVSRL
jgi:hypothetical protein